MRRATGPCLQRFVVDKLTGPLFLRPVSLVASMRRVAPAFSSRCVTPWFDAHSTINRSWICPRPFAMEMETQLLVVRHVELSGFASSAYAGNLLQQITDRNSV